MQTRLKRRQFLMSSAAATGVLLSGTAVLGKSHMAGFNPYHEVDKSLFEGINRLSGEKDTALEKKHVPLIAAPEKIKAGEDFEVTVTMGEIIHPMSQAHYIQYVELLAGNEPVGRMTFSPTFSVPKATFTLRLDKSVTLVAREYCNLHGLWESRKDVVLS